MEEKSKNIQKMEDKVRTRSLGLSKIKLNCKHNCIRKKNCYFNAPNTSVHLFIPSSLVG